MKKPPGSLLDQWLLLPAAHLFVIEMKRLGAKIKRGTQKRQWREIEELRKLGYDVEVHDNADEAIQAVEDRLEAARLSKEGREVHAQKLLRRSLTRSRARENKYKPKGRVRITRRGND